LLPAQQETKGRWNTVEWSKTRRGWLFFPSTNMTRERLMPLTSLWFDLLVMRLLDDGAEDEDGQYRPVWFVLDEVALLQKLPKLHDAITRNRKTNNPVVLGFQGRSQLQKHYGLDAEVMFSQPGTKIFLRTSEPESAKWVSETIGEVEIEQLRESRAREHSPRFRASRNYQLERRIEPLVLASQITGLAERRGYLKSGNAVVQLSFPYVTVPKVHSALIKRVPEALAQEPPKAALATAGADAPRSNGARSESPTTEQKPRREQQIEHAVTPPSKHYFE
jgi:type IV secretory pathway TraG/TraD family ATPase VirD4